MENTPTMRRITLFRNQLLAKMCINNNKDIDIDDDVIIASAVRTPLTKSSKGGLKDTQPEILLSQVMSELLKRGKIKPEQVQEIVIGNVLQNGAGFLSTRISQFLAGFPESTTVMTVNRFCSSGLQAVMNAAYSITQKQVDIAIAGGVESMSLWNFSLLLDSEKLSKEALSNPQANSCLTPMGITSENVAEKFNIDRNTQDEFALASHQKAFIAQSKGYFNEEIVPIKTYIKDTAGKSVPITVSQDDGIRPDTSIQSLSKLKPVFKKGGSTTAGNSSQMTDGAAGVLLMRRSIAMKNNCPILAKVLGFTVAGVPPELMGIGPTVAIPKVLEKVGLSINDIDIFEINEAFASQAVYCAKFLGIPQDKLNPKGGAIALGHPLGCTGARQLVTLLAELKRQKKRYGIVAMCIGTGMGAACVIERE